MPVSHHSRKYLLNERFFSKWSSAMAYTLGFWFADGYMRHDRSYRISFYSLDGDHLEIIRGIIGSTSPIFRSRRNNKLDRSFTLTVHSKILFKDLETLGGRSKKSIHIDFPIVPTKFLSDFIRGYFDGDGSVHIIRYKHTKNKKTYINIRSNFTSGSKIFLEKLRDLLTNYLALYPRKVCQYGPHQFKLGYGQEDTKKLLNFIYYPNCKIYLKRKGEFKNINPFSGNQI